MHGRRGQDAWDAIKWIPRFMIFTVCLVLVLYIFSVLISVQYDAPTLKATSFNAMVLFSDAFSPPNDPGTIALGRFSKESLLDLFVSESEEASYEEEVLVEEFIFAPVGIRVELSSIDGSFDTRELFYEQRTFEVLRGLYIDGRSTVSFVRSENLVRVIDESEPSVRMPGKLVIEVIV